MSSTKRAGFRRSRLAAAAVALAIGAVASPAASAAETPARVAEAGELPDRAIDRADDYWTAKRMRNAKPAPIELAGEPPVAQDDGGEAPELLDGTTPFELADTTSYPNRVHGKVFFTNPGQGNFVCSGTVVDGANDSTVVTAGHCMADGGTWATNFVFVPGYRDGQSPFGVWAASNLYATTSWLLFENLREDFGAAVIARNEAGQELEDVVGARGIAFNQPVQQFYRSHGYPAQSPYTGLRLWACDSALAQLDGTLPLLGGPAALGIVCGMTKGSSGGGWVIDGHRVVSLNSYKYTSQPDVMFGPAFGAGAQTVFGQAQGSTPGSSAAPAAPATAAQPVPFPSQPKCKKVKKGKKKLGGKSKKSKKAKKSKKRKKLKKSCRAARR